MQGQVDEVPQEGSEPPDEPPEDPPPPPRRGAIVIVRWGDLDPEHCLSFGGLAPGVTGARKVARMASETWRKLGESAPYAWRVEMHLGVQ